jgi:hypothetical protein
MGTTEQLSKSVVMEMVLPGMSADLPYHNEDYWSCPSCSYTQYYESWTTVGYYDISSLCFFLNRLDHDALKIGEELDEDKPLYRTLRDQVAEHSQYVCDNCSWTGQEDDLEKNVRYDCSACGENWEHAHDALNCCYGDCERDDCTHRDGIQCEYETGAAVYHPHRTDRMGQTTFFKCWCPQDQPCGMFVCVICHESVNSEPAIVAHRCSGLKSGTPVIVNPANMNVVSPDAVQCYCAADFCCEMHNMHRNGHMLCWVA